MLVTKSKHCITAIGRNELKTFILRISALSPSRSGKTLVVG